jgi:hypothetical protein
MGLFAPRGRPVRRPIALTRLIDTLARLFPDEKASRMVVDHSGLEDGYIAFDARALVNWTNIVNAALRPDRLDDLVDAAGKLHPELLPDMRSLVTNYRKWAERNATTAEQVDSVAAQSAPGIFARARARIVAWSGVALACFAVIGILARESRHLFLGIPGSRWNDLLTSPRECAVEGAAFLGHTAQLAWEYTKVNPIGGAVVVVLALCIWFFRSRLRRVVRNAWAPVIVIPLVIVSGVAKMAWYDAPAYHFESILSPPRNWIRPEILDVRQPLTARTQNMWRAVVCSRVGEQQDFDDVRRTCGSETLDAHAQNVIGTYMLGVLFTLGICITGIAAIRKLILPSQRRDWNLRRADNRIAIALLAAGVLLALLHVPWTYSRTVRSTRYPLLSIDARREFRVCAARDECYSYRPGKKLEAAPKDIPPRARVLEGDILEAMLEEQLDKPPLPVPDSGPRFP